jgi:hypothetical protein
MLLLDGSSSMFEPRETRWDLAFEALMSEEGPVKELEADVRFGFANFRGSIAPHTETDAACADIASVDFAFDNYEAIRELYEGLGDDWTETTKWETPTGHAVNRATEALVADGATTGGKYIVLITDGNPNTCMTLDPQCGQDRSVLAVQNAYAAGIKTYAIGIGDIIEDTLNSGCEPALTRCGTAHLQDLANAGQGLGVEPPPADGIYSTCGYEVGNVFLASYSSPSRNALFYSAGDVTELAAGIRAVLETIVADSQ